MQISIVELKLRLDLPDHVKYEDLATNKRKITIMARLAFFGTPEFSLPALDAVANFAHVHGHTLALVVTQPDARQGRGKMLLPSPVKKRAAELGCLIAQPSSLRKDTPDGEAFYCEFTSLAIDLAIVVAYGKIIPQRFLRAASLGFVNIHGSILPRFRGAAPVQRALEAGDTQTGVCLMDMILKLDEGDVFALKTTPILASDTSKTLFRRLSHLGAYLLSEHLGNLIQQRLAKSPQSSQGVLYAHMLDKHEGAWKHDSPGRLISHRARAFDPWPTLYGFVNNKRVMFFDSFFIATKHHRDKQPGTVVVISDFLGIRAVDGIVYFQTIQLENKKRLSIKEALASHSINIGDQITHFSS